MALSDFLNLTMSVLTQTVSQDAGGGMIRAPQTTRIPSVPTCLWPASAAIREEFARQDSVADFMFVTAQDIAATTNDLLSLNGQTYNVIGYKNWQMFGMSVYLTVTGKRNQPA